MDFFKSVFSNEPEPRPELEESSPNPQNPPHSDPSSPTSDLPQNPNPNPNPSSLSAWSFDGLIKTIATRYESVIETYLRDLDEFRSSLKKETGAIVDVTSRAVRELPVSLDACAAAAQAKLESVGHVIDEFSGSVWRGTAEIITHGKDALADLGDKSPKETGPTEGYDEKVDGDVAPPAFVRRRRRWVRGT